ncbi:MAG: dihydroneopterin aldolase [Fibrobacteria bacterium]|nr:dihydroneopterin aldolase [Fibrobacteria bacterium]
MVKKSNMEGLVKIKNLKVNCFIGILPEEKSAPQDLFLSITFSFESTKAAETDDIAHTVDYAKLTNFVQSHLQKNRYNLLECMAEKLIISIFSQWEKILWCKLTIKKPGAIPQAEYASYILERAR